MKNALLVFCMVSTLVTYGQVDTSFVYNTNTPFGTLDIRIAKSSTRYYYLQENITVSYRQDASGNRTNTFRDMTSWDSSPYSQGNLRERNGSADYFVMNYRLLFPLGYQAAYQKGYPLIVMMHGAGERGNCWDDDCYWANRSWRYETNSPPAPTSSTHQLLNNDHNLLHGGKQHLDARNLAGTRLPDDPSLPSRAFPGFVLFGQTMNGWDSNSIHDMLRLIRLVVKKYNIDPDRIYIHGLSNGGIATYNMIKRAPWLFAAVLPMSSPTEAAIINQGLLEEVAHIPIWTFQGGRDVEPAPSRTEAYVRRFREAGADVRYTLYPNLGHGTWNDAYAEPDFFSWMLSKSKKNIHVFYGSTTLCNTSNEGVKLGLAAGFLAYQWEKDGTTIPNSNFHEYVADEPGVYRARFSRTSTNPTASQWEEWSPPVTITGSSATKPEIVPLTTTHLRGPDNQTPNTITLKAGAKADRYLWYRNGVLINIPNNNMDDTVSMLTITGTSTNNNGAYTLRTAGFEGCQSPASDPINLYFNNSAPLIADSNVPGSFRVSNATSSTVSLAWSDQSSSELAYEIWRRAPGESFVLAGRAPSNSQSFTDVNLKPSTTYEYKLRAVNNQGRSRYAPNDNVNTNLQATTGVDTQAPTIPGNLRLVRNTTSSISLQWDASTDNNGISHYVISYGGQQQSTEGAVTSHVLSGLPINTSYQITVRAVDIGGMSSAASNQITASTSVSGLWYGHTTGAWGDLDEITSWDEPEVTGWVPNFTLDPRTQDEYFNFQFDGYLFIEEAGNYYFYLNSDDGSRLFIDGNVVVDFDGLHGTSGSNGGFGVRSTNAIPLSAGAHEIRVRFFEFTGGEALTVAYQGADTDNQIRLIPDAALTSGPATPAPTNNAPVVNITSPTNNQAFTAPANITITATASDSDGSVVNVEFFNGETKLGEDNSSPYSFAWNGVGLGTYTINVKATDDDGASTTASVNVTVNGASASCEGAGQITREVWTGISGVLISAIPLNDPPQETGVITLFEAPSNVGDNYGTRIRGYVCPPVSGNYTFWISGNDRTELWLSTDQNPENKRLIASPDGFTNERQWNKYASQQSAPIALTANQRYYIEALHKEGVGTDHVAVGWQLPGGTLERPIPGNRLIPFGDPGDFPARPVVAITSPANGAMFDAPASINITATASISGGAIDVVEFFNGDVKLGEDTSSPYSFAWNNVEAGSYTLMVRATADNGEAEERTVSVWVTPGGSSECFASGMISREVWTGVPYADVGSIPLNAPPNVTSELTIFEIPSNWADNYGTRVRGYICPPTTGAYVFWIASNDHSELWLSTDDNPDNRQRIAWTTAATNARQWDKFASQQSNPVVLVQGQRYYIEALHKEGVGSDHMAVGWQLPNGTLERPIQGTRLSPFMGGMTMAMTSMGEMSTFGDTGGADARLSVYPNPAQVGVSELVVSGFGFGNYFGTMEIQRLTGEVVVRREFSCEGGCDDQRVSGTDQLAPGVYLVSIVTNGNRTVQRLVVK